jgi:predicted glycosyltransferase
MTKSVRKVLVCPLDWGIGHATRCVPVIRKLLEMNAAVIIAADQRPLDFLKKEFPELTFIRFPGTRITYPAGSAMTLRMLRILPNLLCNIRKEHQLIRQIAAETGASLVISDNRFGCWVRNIPSVFITHQLDIGLPRRLRWLNRIIRTLNYWFIRHYDECWIPDFELHRGLAGSLSHPPKLPRNASYIGILSRFSGFTQPIPDPAKPPFDLMVMLSGPEPQRTLLEEKILAQLGNINMKVVIVRGITEKDEIQVIDDRIFLYSHPDTARMHELMALSGIIICRSGYSSIMDVVTLGRRAIFIPTPGQPEQEYLSRYLLEKKIYFSMNQANFDLLYAIEMSKNFPGMVIRNDYQELENLLRRHLC